VARHIFQACPVWIYTQSNITSILSTNVKKYDFSIALQRMLHQAIKPRVLTFGARLTVRKSQYIGAVHWAYKDCETSCKRDVTLCNALKMRCSVPQSLQKVEPDSTSCNGYCNNNIARLVDLATWYTLLSLQFRVHLCSHKIARQVARQIA
jgi:hypothetical protein